MRLNKLPILYVVIAVLVLIIILFYINQTKNSSENVAKVRLLKELNFKPHKNKLALNDNLSGYKNKDDSDFMATELINNQQRIDQIIYNGLEFNLGETKNEIITNLGEPLKIIEKSIISQHRPDVADKLYDLIYDGFSVRVYHATTDDKELVLKITIENRKFKVKYGLNIGATEEFVSGVLGPPYIKENNIYEYNDSNGFAKLRFSFESGSLVKIEWYFDEN